MKFRIFLFLIGTVILNGCSKDFLEETPDKALTVPNSLGDLRALLDNDKIFSSVPGVTDVACENFSFSDAIWNSKNYVIRNAYIWSKDVFKTENFGDWNLPYEQIYVCNVILEALEKLNINENEQSEYNQIKGTALFYRGLYFHCLQEVFGEPYVTGEAVRDLGIPLRINTSLNEYITRSTGLETFNQVVSDLRDAYDLLNKELPESSLRYRPSKAAAAALLARVYLIMQEYEESRVWANQSIELHGALVDYNDFNENVTRPFPNLPMAEVLLSVQQLNYALMTTSTVINESFYNSYNKDDLRRNLFFRFNASTNSYYFRGQYTGSLASFGGIATDEIYLIRAETNVRLGNPEEAIEDLNKLLKSRWKKDAFVPYVSSSDEEILFKIIDERKKQLAFRGLRWSDLRRLNQDDRFLEVIKRTVEGKDYFLSDLSFPIPDQEMKLNPIIQRDFTK